MPSMPPDYASAIDFALHLLRTQLPASCTYHCAQRTELDVMRTVRRLARLSGVTAQESQQLQVAAAYHDVGYIRTVDNHVATSIEIMSETLPDFGFCGAEVETITAMVQATRMPQAPRNSLEALLADADLDSLGREDFLQTSTALWQEQKVVGRCLSWGDWLRAQLRFLQEHRYFTPAASQLRDAGKQSNIALLRQLIEREKLGLAVL